ncbi:M56 family metallopeptidase [Flavobacterium sp. XGLA_31]|uniref:M56 family metallopeptidase n=1 Tax=Flavobacterium sp. XGLA_31 TaxID=3447666 RepID=UPI003F2AC0B9
MEIVFIYLLKASGLIAMFYLAYHFLVRKETFFDGNRWFLLSGLFTAALLPLFFITKIVLVEKPKISMEQLVAYSQSVPTSYKTEPVVEAFDWMQFIWFGYLLIVCVLAIKIVLNLTSLYRMLHNKPVFKRNGYTLVDLEDNISPFSFFGYIVYNSDFYSDSELQSILLHEEIHSREKHSFDILVAKLFCVVFWFNPFVWLYKKAIAQNLEYIADQKAIAQLDDRQAYQRALLKVVSHQNCLSITNHFYQSLIKKRIVMLNTHQSQKRNSWKYALVIPALVGFVLLFQIKVIAQEKEEDAFVKAFAKGFHNGDEVRVKIDKNSSDEQLKREAERLKKDHGVTLKVSKVKRNTSGEITGIKVEYKDKNGHKGVNQVNGDEPIAPIHFYKNDQAIGFGHPKNPQIFVNAGFAHPEAVKGFVYHNNEDSIPEINEDIDVNVEIPENIIGLENADKNIIINGKDKKPLIVINGKVISDNGEIDKIMKDGNFNFSFNDDEDGERPKIIINGKEIMKIADEGIANVQLQIKRLNPQIRAEVRRGMQQARAEMDRARAEMRRNKPEMDRAQTEAERSRPEMEKAKAEMLKAKEEMIQAKEEMLKAKAELDKAKADMKQKRKK